MFRSTSLSNSSLPPEKEFKITLSEFTQKALDILSSNECGFFLMVEGSQIDWAGHDNDNEYLISETIAFDKAVGIGLQFAKKHSDTLIIVTADHETGGYAPLQGSVEKQMITKAAFTTTGHTGEMVPLFAYGPASQRFGGIHDNTYIGKTLIELVLQID